MTYCALLVEDHEIVATGIGTIADETNVELFHVSTLAKARTLLSEQQFDVLVLDLYLPDGNGLELCRDLLAQDIQIPTILISAMLNGIEVQRAMELGVEGLVSKTDPVEELKLAVTEVLAGNHYQSKSAMELVSSLNGGEYLTSRSLQVLHGIMSGLPNKQIADQLGITESTVSFHLAQLKKKLHARTNRQLVFKALQLGLGP